jgi:ribosomal protein L37AE/L43A
MSGHGRWFDSMVADEADDEQYAADVRAERQELAAERTANSLRLDLTRRIAGVTTIGDDTLLADIREMRERERRVDAGLECPTCAGSDIRREREATDLFICNDSACRTSWLAIDEDE